MIQGNSLWLPDPNITKCSDDPKIETIVVKMSFELEVSYKYLVFNISIFKTFSEICSTIISQSYTISGRDPFGAIWFLSGTLQLYCAKQASADEDGRLRTVHPSIRPCGQRTKIWAQPVHLMDKFGRWTKIIILKWTSGRIFYHGPSTSWTESDDRPRLSFWGGRVDGFLTMDRPLHGRIRTTDDRNFHLMDGGGRVDRQTDRQTIHQFRIYTITIFREDYSIDGLSLG